MVDDATNPDSSKFNAQGSAAGWARLRALCATVAHSFLGMSRPTLPSLKK
jgi:hypothetical protein